jgi:hypothetical protein
LFYFYEKGLLKSIDHPLCTDLLKLCKEQIHKLLHQNCKKYDNDTDLYAVLPKFENLTTSYLNPQKDQNLSNILNKYGIEIHDFETKLKEAKLILKLEFQPESFEEITGDLLVESESSLKNLVPEKLLKNFRKEFYAWRKKELGIPIPTKTYSIPKKL